LYDTRPALVAPDRSMLRRQVPIVVLRLLRPRRLLAGLLCSLVSGACATLFGRGEPLPVKPVEEPIVVAAWAEPRQLPAGGGEVQILVRIQRRGGRRFPGVEVRLATSHGSLFSGSRVLVTDAQGMTRDRLATRKTAVVTLNAGGTRYRFRVPVAKSP
jgi:hypothetical protein